MKVEGGLRGREGGATRKGAGCDNKGLRMIKNITCMCEMSWGPGFYVTNKY